MSGGRGILQPIFSRLTPIPSHTPPNHSTTAVAAVVPILLYTPLLFLLLAAFSHNFWKFSLLHMCVYYPRRWRGGKLVSNRVSLGESKIHPPVPVARRLGAY